MASPTLDGDVATQAPESRPNLLIFMPDQLRYDSVGCFGNPHVRTPNIDAFAARGTKFTNCYLQATSRCSLYTGQYPHVSGHRSLENLIKPWEPNMFRSLKESGYHVACLAPRGDTFAPTVTELSVTEYGFLVPPEWMPKFGKGGAQEPSEDIWDRLFYKGLRSQDKTVDYDEAAVRSAIKWLENPPKGPWVLYLPLIFPHCPFQVEEPYFSMYDRKKMPVPSKPEDKSGYEARYFAENRKRYGTERATDEIWAEITATYYGMISRLDTQFGQVMKALENTGLEHKTVTAFYTDHGEYLGDHGMIEKWPSGVSEVLAREPLIIGGAGLPMGKTNDDICEMVDLLPTIFELCEVPELFPHNGLSLLPTILGNKKHQKQYAYTEGGFLKSEGPLLEQAPYPYDIKSILQHQETELVGKAVSMRSKEWTYVYRLYEPPELYNRKTDLGELHNLAADPSLENIVREMQGVMFRWIMETSDFLPFHKDARFPPVSLESPEEQYRKRIGET
ncbi:unnamed protein product [Penicillium bialowiezense]